MNNQINITNLKTIKSIKNVYNYVDILKQHIKDKHKLIQKQFHKNKNPEQIKQLFNDIRSLEVVLINELKFLEEYTNLCNKFKVIQW